MISKLFLLLLYLALFISGVNQDTIGLSILISFVASCVGLMYIGQGKNAIKIPKNFAIMVLFVIVLHAYLFFINDKLSPFYYAVIITEGLVYWLIFYNIEEGGKLLKSILINFSLAYSFFYVISILFKINLVALAEPFFNGGTIVRHWNIGDLWAFTLISIIASEWGKFKYSTWVIIALGFIFIAISNVRSAMFALAIGLIYFFTKNTVNSTLGKVIKNSFVGICIIFFILSGANKTTLFDRPYFAQSIQAFSYHPLGVGIGNFKQIAKEFHLNGTDSSQLAIHTFNIFLETLSGVGVFSIIFLIFLLNIFRDLLRASPENLAWGAVTLTIIANFMTDASYTIPSLVWILFITIGVFQSKQKSLTNL